MALSYLSGDEIGKSKEQRKQDRKKKKEDRKAGGGTVKQKVKKVAVAPARAAFLSVTILNAMKLATKLARMWNAPGGKARLESWWKNYGGDPSKLRDAIAKGSKQSISQDEMGSIALGAALLTATPLIIAIVPLIKEFKAGGDAAEMNEFDALLNQQRSELGESTEFETGYANMPNGAVVGKYPKVATQAANQSKGGGGATEGSAFSPLGIFFKTPLLLSLLHAENPILLFLISVISGICVLGMILLLAHYTNPFGVIRFTQPVMEKMFSGFDSVKSHSRILISRIYANRKIS